MKKSVCFIVILFFGIQFTGEAQILKKFGKIAKDAVKEVKETAEDAVVEEVTKELGLSDEEPQQAQTKETTATNFPVSGKEVSSGELNVRNQFEAVTEKVVFGDTENFLKQSPDGSLIATRGFEGSRPVILINGKADPHMDEYLQELNFTRAKKRYYYLGKRDGKCIVVIDGKEVDTGNCEQYRNSRFKISPDETVIAIYKRDPNQAPFEPHPTGNLILNGQAGPQMSMNTAIKMGGNAFYYLGKKGIYKNNELLANHPPVYNFHESFQISDDGEVYMYVTLMEKGNKGLVVNGKLVAGPVDMFAELKMYPSSGAIQFRAVNTPGPGSSAPVATSAKLLWKGKEFSIPDGILKYGHFLQSPDGEKLHFVTMGMNGSTLWTNGDPGPIYGEISDVIYTGDWQKFLYVGHNGGKSFLVENGIEKQSFDIIEDLRTAPKGANYTFLGKEGTSVFRYLNDIRLGPSNEISEITFSPDGRRYVYESGAIGQKEIVLDGKALNFPDLKGIEVFDQGTSKSQVFVFDPTGKHLAFSFLRLNKTTKKNELVLVLDEAMHVIENVNLGFSSPTFSVDGSHFAFLSPLRTADHKLFWQLYLDMEPGPIVGSAKKDRKNPSVPYLEFTGEVLKVHGSLDGQILSHTISLK